MHKQFYIVVSALLLGVMVLSACGSAAPAQAPAPAEPVEAPAAAEPTQPPAEVEPTEAPAASEPTKAPAANEPQPAAEMGMLPEVNPAEVSGDVIAAGSSTVFPLSERMAERFQQEGYTGKITIDSIGSGAGFERFCKTGETDISNASRKIKDSEVEACAAINRTPVEFRVGTDAIAVVVSQENAFLTDVTLEDLAKIFTTAQKWSDVNPAWPENEIQRFSPGTDSGTFDFFVEVVLQPAFDKDAKAAKAAILDAANIQFSEDDNVLVQGVQGSPYAIGYFGYAYYAENEENMNAISLDGIAPSFETAEANTYPLSRPLFIYSDAAIMKQKPQVASFINYYLTYVNEEIGTVGYFPASEEALNEAKQAWLDAVK